MRRTRMGAAALIALIAAACLCVVSAEREDGLAHRETAAYPDPLPPGSTLEAQLAWKREFTEWAGREGLIQHAAGEETGGAVITVADRKVKLPDDAYVKAYVVMVEPASEHAPYYVIQRGHSTVAISERTGYVLNLSVDEADRKPFRFLKHYVKGYLEGVDKIK